MANDDAIGFSIDIPDKVFDDLNKVDEKIDGLQKTANSTAKAVANSFKEMANGVNPFLEALKRANEDISKLNKSGAGDLSAGMNKTTEAATQMANSIVGVTTELNKMDASSMNIAELTATIKEMNDQLRKGGGVELSDQQALVERRNLLKEELKAQESTDDKAYTSYARRVEREYELAQKAANDKIKAYQKALDAQAKADRQTTSEVGRADIVADWRKVQLEIDELNKRQEKLNNLVKEYQFESDRIAQGKGGIKKVEAYKEALKEIEANNAAIATYKSKQQAIIENEKALKSQEQTLKNIKSYASEQGSLPEQQKNRELERMNEWYKQLEISSRKEAEAEEKAYDAYWKRIEQQQKKEAELEAQRAKYAKERQKAEYSTSYAGALDYSKTANTVNKEIEAVRRLTEARNNLSKTDANYEAKLRTLNEAIKTHTKNIREATAGANEANKSHRNLMDTAGQLQRRLALVFSVSQVYGYVKNLVQVRAEFELQNRALAALLQNKDKADRLFAQITELAVKSPFTVKELVTYTKQLAAYQFESEKLYDTTKRLADVSAGLGVDMGRLILALGQVKAANYLRGTEVRQFTEAGFNILGELAKYYQELEGRMVSVAEVQERVTKRMVSFGDVETIFKRVTDAGGLFYNMQAIQAETLSGQISNLRDSIDIMFNEIGKANDGALKDAVAAVRSLVENWETLASVLKQVGGAFIAYKAYTLLMSNALSDFIIKQNVATATVVKSYGAISRLFAGIEGLGRAIKSASIALKGFVASNAWLLAIVAAVDAIFSLVGAYRDLKAAQSEVNKEFNDSYATITKISKAYNTASKEVDGYKKKLTELSELKDYLEGKGYTLTVPIEFVTPDNIDQIFTESAQLAMRVAEFGKELGMVFAKSFNGVELGGLLGENLRSDLKDLSAAYSEIGAGFASRLSDLENSLMPIYDQLTDKSKQYYDEIEKGQAQNEPEAKWLMRKAELMEKIWAEQVKINNGELLGQEYYKQMLDLMRDVWEAQSAEREVQYEMDKVLDRLVDRYGSIENVKKEIGDDPMILYAEIDRIALEENLDETTRWIMKYLAAQRFEYQLDVTAPKISMPQFTNDFKDTLRALDTQGLFKNSMDSINSLLDLQNALIKMYKQNMEELEVLNQANTKQLDLQNQIAEAKRKVAETTGAEQVAAQAEMDNLQRQKQTVDEQIEASKKKIELENESIINISKSFNLKYQEQKVAKSTNNIYKEQLSLIKQMGEAYKKYRQYYSEAESNELVRKEFSQAAQDAGIGNLVATMTFDASGIIAGLEEIGKNGGKAISKEVNKSIADLKTEVNIDVKKVDVENVSKALDDMFAKYEFGKELEKIGIGKELGSQIFGIDAFDLEELGRSLETYKKSLGDVGTEFEKQFTEAEKKVTDMQEKEYTERLKTYSGYLKKTIDERVAAEYAAQKEIAKLQGMDEFTSAQKQSIQDAINKEKNKKLDEMAWKDFQGTDMYISLFKDMETQSSAAIEVMLKRLNDLRESLKNLSPEQLKAIQEQISKLEDEQMQRNPFKNLGDNLKGFIDLLKQRRDLEKQLSASAAQEDILYGNVKDQSQNVASLKQQYDLAVKKYGIDSKQASVISDQLIEAEKLLDANKKDLDIQREKTGEIQDQLTALQKQALNLATAFNGISDILGSIGGLVSDISSGLENMGVNLDSTFGDVLTSITEISSAVQQTVQGAGTLATGIATGNVIQGIQGAIQTVGGLFKTIGSIFAIGDKSKERQIKNEQKAVERLQKAYEDLQEVQSQSVNISDDYSALEAQRKNIDQQIASYERMIQLEYDKKDSDQGKIDEWRNQIDELRKEQKEIEKEFIQSYGGFGDNESQKDAAQEFIDEWLDAFKETGDGLDALKDKWTEYFDTILKKQMMMKAFEKYMNPVMDYIDKALEDGEVTVEEWEKAQDLSEEASEKLNEFLKQMADKYGVQIGVDGDSLSGLSKGIQSITEETALVLESLLNSMRFFVSDSNSQLKSILAAITSQDTMQNPILGELKAQTALLRSINNFFGSVIASGDHPYGGKFLKVAF